MLAGGRGHFRSVALISRLGDDVRTTTVSVAGLENWLASLDGEAAERLTQTWTYLSCRRHWLGGTPLSEPKIMGILNITPDSFSDGGRYLGPNAAIKYARDMIAAGANLIDVGGESTRPGAEPISPATEAGRIVPIISQLAEKGVTVSVDSRNASTMQEAVQAGAAIVNDVSALSYDPSALSAATALGVPVILMHSRGDPKTMQDQTRYEDVVLDVYDALSARIECAVSAGITRDRIMIDPGIGFAKTPKQNFALFRWLALFHGLGCPIVIGASRKSFIGAISGEKEPSRRVPGSLTAAVMALEKGAQVLRVHDVVETKQAISVWQAVRYE